MKRLIKLKAKAGHYLHKPMDLFLAMFQSVKQKRQLIQPPFLFLLGYVILAFD
jgi:hypothetical protein